MLDSKRIIHGIRSQNHLDEAASAYKSIGEVMANQQDIVKIITTFSLVDIELNIRLPVPSSCEGKCVL